VGRLQLVWLRLSGNLWFLPTVMTTLAVALSTLTIILDDWVIATGRARHLWFVFGVGAEGVRGVLSSIAGGIITVTGVVFSITVVALQLASTQFTPRVLRTFIGDRANQVVLGVFIGTFTYALLILRFVRSEADGVAAFVPSISVTVAMLLAVASVGFLIFFINHIAQSITASAVIDRLTREGVDAACRAFPCEIGRPASSPTPEDRVPTGEPIPVRTDGRGYLQAVDEEALLDLAGVGPLVIRMEGRVGEFFNSGDVVASVWLAATPARADAIPKGEIDRLRRTVLSAFVFGTEPTGPQDVALGISRLVDVAVKALSPGINDPTTAAMCIDGIGEVLIVLGGRDAPAPVREARGGEVRLHARRPEFGELADLAFAQLRHYGARDPAVAVKLVVTLRRVAVRVPPSRRGVLARQVEHVARAAEAQVRDEADCARVRLAAARVLAEIGPHGAPAGAAAEAS
jgi:uncharacterized membrane protein